MAFEGSNDDYEDNSTMDNLDLDDSHDLSDDEEDDQEDDSLQSESKGRSRGNEQSLEVRRAIEDHLERTRLQKDLDYLFDEKFTDED